MAISNVSVYTRTTENGKRRYEQADHRTSYPDGTIFCLRYEGNGNRKWETLIGDLITYKYALACAKLRESDLLMGAINVAKHAPVVPVAKEPEKPTRMTVDQAIDRYLRNASTKSPRTYHGYTYTMRQFRESCQKQFLDQITKQERSNRKCTWQKGSSSWAAFFCGRRTRTTFSCGWTLRANTPTRWSITSTRTCFSARPQNGYPFG